jgi:hypothetical protein
MSRLPWARARRPAPCAAATEAGPGGRYVHPEGACACFRGGPAPVLVEAPEIAALADHPGVFDTSWIGQPTGRPDPELPVTQRVRIWLSRLRGR